MPAIDEEFDGTVRDLTAEGVGVVAHDSGQLYQVAGVWRGESGRFRVTGYRKRTGFAELVALTEPSPLRVTAPCPHHGVGSGDCGGCPWQFMAVEAQLQEKQDRVARVMAHLGVAEQVRPVWAAPADLGYRNRAQLKSDGRRIGYMSARSNDLVAIEDCPVLSDHNRHTLAGLLASLPNRDFRPRGKHRWVSLDIDEDVTAASVSVNRRRPFRQGNSAQNRRMRAWLAERLAALPRPPERALELFAGSGNFTEVIAAAGVAEIVAVEGAAEALETLEERGLAGVSCQVANLFDNARVRELGMALADGHSATTALVLDPPREGFKAVEELLATVPTLTDILYISCNLATFARDVAVMQSCGFSVAEVQPLDQFPHTPHIELLATLHRQPAG